MENDRKSREAPGPAARVGLAAVTSLWNYARDPLNFLADRARQYGPMMKMRFGKYDVMVVSGPEYIDEVLKKTNKLYIKENRTPQSRTVRKVFGNGLLTGEGESWKRQRRLVQPAFVSRQMSAYAEEMLDRTIKTSSNWQDGEILDIYQELRHITRDIGAKIFFGLEISEEAKELGDVLERMSDHVIGQTRIFLVPEKFPTPKNLRFNRDLAKLDEIVYEMIARRRTRTDVGGDILHTMLQAEDVDGSKLSDRQLRDEVITLYVAGHETVALTVTWALHLLMKEPGCQERVFEEVRMVLGKRRAALSDFERLPVLGAVINEGLRLFPPIWRIGRQALEETEIGGFRIPKDSIILISQWLIHRDARWFDEPERFNPDRWLDGSLDKLPKYCFLPFGGGPRVCVAMNLALVEATLVLSTLIQSYEFESADHRPVELSTGVTLRPKNGILARLKARHQIGPISSPPQSELRCPVADGGSKVNAR